MTPPDAPDTATGAPGSDSGAPAAAGRRADSAPVGEAYSSLEHRFARIARLDDALGVLHWDFETTMPDGAASGRAETLATLGVLRHEHLVAPEVGEWLDAAAGDRSLDDWQAANLREMRRAWRHATAVPGDLIEAASKASSHCQMAWRRAREESDFGALLPSLTEVLDLTRRIAEAKGDAFGVDPYDALLDEYDPGSSAARLDPIFDDLAGFLPDFTERVLAHQARRPAPIRPEGHFPIDRQRGLARRLMEAIGFDFSRGRLDVSTHPFCGGGLGDVRVTTRYSETDFARSLMAVLHETGHAMYEMGLPEAWRAQPVGADRGMAVHESQSLMVEMQAARSKAFIDYAAPLIRETFGGDGPAWTADNLHRLYTRVERGLIRVDADEVTYPAHVILRYRLERQLIKGELKLVDLPAAWNAGMAELVGVTPPNDALGCLQDIHWPGGGFGYFPTYTLGAMTAAQLFDAASRADPEIEPAIGRGDFSPLMHWLRTHVHGVGCVPESGDALLEQATGRPLDVAVFKRHLERRYLGA
ncbi:MAG: carboxypeptidase M32 [Azospirillaceae bacterium]